MRTTNVHINYDFILSSNLHSPNLYINWADIWYPDYQNKKLNFCIWLAKWLSVRLRTKWFWVRVQLQSLELTIYAILCRNVNILALWFYQQELASLFQKQEKLKVSRSTYSIADDGHVKIERLHVVVSPNMIFCAFELMSIYWNTIH